MTKIYEYDVAISFAGEDRKFAKFIATKLTPQFDVFYDEFEKAALWGSDLSDALPRKYLSARYCLIIQSDDYLKKAWTTLERQAIIFEFLKRRGADYVLPVRVRNCSISIPGLSDLIGYLTVNSTRDWLRIVQLIRLKLLEK